MNQYHLIGIGALPEEYSQGTGTEHERLKDDAFQAIPLCLDWEGTMPAKCWAPGSGDDFDCQRWALENVAPHGICAELARLKLAGDAESMALRQEILDASSADGTTADERGGSSQSVMLWALVGISLVVISYGLLKER